MLKVSPSTLKGHQIIGELRLTLVPQSSQYPPLKGHQIIGELRPIRVFPSQGIAKLKGHQIIGELRLWRPAFRLSDIN